MQKAIVTGGLGFIGSHLVERLLKEGHRVVAIDNLVNGRLSNLADLSGHPAFTFIEADIAEPKSYKTSFKNADLLFHLAALADIVPSIEEPEQYYQTNVTGTLNVLQLARSYGIKKTIYAASSSCYGIPEKYPTPETAPCHPQYPYALTKYLGEQIALHWGAVYKLNILSLRLFNVYGPRQSTKGAYGRVLSIFLAQKLADKPLTIVGDGKQTRDFTYVTDVVDAMVLAAQSDLKNEILNVGSGNTYSVNELARQIGGKKIFIPKRPGEPGCTFADVRKILRLLGWRPRVELEMGVGELLKQIDHWAKAPVWTPAKIEKATRSWFACLSNQNR